MTADLCQSGRHGCFPTHAVADQDALVDTELGEEVVQIIRHRLVGQHGVVRAVAVVTGIYCQHLTGQRTVRTLGLEKRRRESVHAELALMSAVSVLGPARTKNVL